MIPENIHDCQSILMHFDCNNCKYKNHVQHDCQERMKFQDDAGIKRKSGLTFDKVVEELKNKSE